VKLSRFWRALEDLPAGADTLCEWWQRLGDDLTAAEQLLRRTGRLAKVLSCPSPGGDHCPRRIVHQADGSIVAVCGNRPTECDPVDITLDDVAIYAFDARGLGDRLGRLLGLRPEFRPVDDLPRTWQIGRADIAAGCSFPVYLTIPSEEYDLFRVASKISRLASGPFGVLAPTRRYLSADAVDVLSRNASDAAALEELMDVSPSEELACVASLEVVFPRAWAAALPADDCAKRAWILPADARWEHLVLEFEAEQMLRGIFRGESRSFEPVDLGMRDARTKKPTLQWTSLQALAIAGGSLRAAKPSEANRIKKQKQLLADKLRAAFGIEEDPLPWDPIDGVYRARFVIRGTVLRRAFERRLSA
jgi:hypothetical protein